MTSRFTARTIWVFLVLVLVSCFGDSTGPGELRRGRVSLVPSFRTGAHLVEFDEVRIRLTRPPGNEVVLDTIVVFPAGADSLLLSLDVPIIEGSEDLTLVADLIDQPSGNTVFTVGPVTVTVQASGGVPQTLPPFLYTGVGANAVGVRFVATPSAVFFGDTVVFTAEAFDASNAVIPNAPILWSTSDSARGNLPADSAGRVVARNSRGPVTITASLLPSVALPTPPTAARQLIVQPRPNAITVQAGSGQTVPVGSTITPVTARVLAADLLGVQGVEVVFAVTGGGGSLSALRDTTDANGDASVSWTLGGTVGPQSVSATATGVPAASVAFGATGSPGAPASLDVVQPPPALTDEDVMLAPAITVRALDGFGNANPSFAGSVTVTLVNAAGAVLGGTQTRVASGGVATFDDLTVDNPGTGYRLAFSSGSLAPDTSTAFAIASTAPTQLTFAVQPATSVAGSAIAPAVQVALRDAEGDLSPSTASVTLALGTNPGNATLGGTVSVAAVGGIATFSDLTIDSARTGYTIVASSPGVANLTSSSFDVVSGPPVRLGFTVQPSNAEVNAAIAPPVTVRAFDAIGNPTGMAGTITVELLDNPGGATLGGTLTQPTAGGIATFADLTVSAAGLGYTLRATATGVASDTSATFDISALPAVALEYTVQPPALAFQGSAFSVTVRAIDALGGTVTGFTNPVQVSMGNNPAGGTLSGTLSRNAAGGLVTFDDLAIDTMGTEYTLVASSLGLTSATSNSFTVGFPSTINQWTNTAGGNWGTATNWSLGTVPAAADTVVIALNGSYTVNVDVSAAFASLVVGGSSGTQTLNVAGPGVLNVGGSATFNTNGALVLGAGGTITGPDTVLVSSSMSWTGGSFTGAGATRVLPGASVSISGTAARALTGTYLLELGANAAWSGSHQIDQGGGSVLRVLPGATLDVQGDPSWNYIGGTAIVLDVQGTLLRTTSASPFGLPLWLEVPGTMTAVAGGILMNGSGIVTGTLNAASLIDVVPTNGNYDLTGTSSVAGAGEFRVSGGQIISSAGAWSVATTRVTGGTLNIGSAAGSTGNLDVTGGILGGSGQLTVTGSMTWSGGQIGSTNGQLVIPAGAALTLSGSGGQSLNNHRLDVAGSLVVAPTATVFVMNSSAILTVQSGGLLDLQSDQTIAHLSGAAPSLHVQAGGALTRSAGTGLASINVPATIDGSFTQSAGSLDWGNTSSVSGTVTVAAGAVLNLTGSLNVGAGGTMTGPGELRSNGNFTMNGSYAIGGMLRVLGGVTQMNNAAPASITDVELGGGATLAGSGTVTVTNGMSWTGGTLGGTGGILTIPAGVTVTASTTGPKTISAHTVNIGGSLIVPATAPAQTIGVNSSAQINVLSGGVIDLQDNHSIIYQSGAAPMLHVQAGGALNRTDGTGTAQLNLPMVVDGALSQSTGTLTWNNTVTVNSGATVTAAAGSILQLGGTMGFAAGSSLSGAGEVLSNGTVTVNGTWGITGSVEVQANTLTMNAGVLTMPFLEVADGATFSGTSDVTVTTGFSWMGGTIGGNGGVLRLPAGLNANAGPTGSRTLTAHNLEIGGAFQFAGLPWALTMSNAALIDVIAGGTVEFTNNHSIVQGAGAPAQITIQPSGAFTRTFGNGTSTIGVNFTNLGTLGHSAGGILLFGGTTGLAGTVTATGGTLATSGNATINAIASGGAGLTVMGGTTTVLGSYGLTGALRVETGTLTMNTAATVGQLELVGGTLDGTGTIEVAGGGTMTWGTTTVGGGNGLLRLLASATGVSTAGLKNLSLHQLEIAGTLTMDNSGIQQLNVDNSAQLRILNGGHLQLQGPHSILYGAGAPSALHVQAGGLLSSSLGLVQLSVPMQLDGQMTLGAGMGELRWNGDVTITGQLGIAAGALVVIESGSHTWGSTSAISGDGAVSIQGGTVSLASAPALTSPLTVAGGALSFDNGAPIGMQNLDVTSGTVGGPGTVQVSGIVNWNGGQIGAGGGTLQIGSTGTMNILGAVTHVLAGPYLLQNDGTAMLQAGSMQVNNGAILRNTAGGIFDLRSDGSIGTLGGGATIENLGTLRRSVDVNPFTIAIPVVSASPGSVIDIQGTPLSLEAGGTLGGGVITTGPAAHLDLGNGAFALADTLRVQGNLFLSDGVLDLAGRRLTVTSDLSIIGLSTIPMHAGDSVVVGGSAVFGGSTAGQLDGGTLIVGGNFTQAGLPLSFDATGTHTTVLNGATNAVISFGSPASSQFRNLRVALRGNFSANFSSSGRVSGWMSVDTGTVLAPVAGTRLTVGDSLRVNGPFTGMLGAWLALGGVVDTTGSGVVSMDTTAFIGAGQTMPPNIFYNSVVIATADSVRSVHTRNIGGLLKVEAGLFSASNTSTVTISDSLVVTGTGRLAMDPSEVSIQVNGHTLWNTQLSNALASGALILRGSFTQQQTVNPDNFAGGPSFTMSFDGTNPQVIEFQTPGNSTLGSTTFANNASVIIAGNGAVARGVGTVLTGSISGTRLSFTDSLYLNPGTMISGMGRLDVGYLVQGANTASVTADTIGFTQRIDSIPAEFIYNNVLVNTNGLSDSVVSRAPITIGGSLFVDQGVFLARAFTTVTDSLVTRGNGVLSQVEFPSFTTIDVGRDVRFGGGSTAGYLLGGELIVRGNFVQNGDPQSFAPSSGEGPHRVTFDGIGLQTATFANPGPSYFQMVRTLSGRSTGTLRFLSRVHVENTLDAGSPTTIVDATADTLFLHTASIFDGSHMLQPNRIVLRGQPNFLPDSIFGSVTADSGAMSVSWAGLAITGQLHVTGGPVNPGYFVLDNAIGNLVSVGSLLVDGQGQVEMSYLDGATVNGNAVFAGTVPLVNMTLGTLRIGGNLSQSGHPQSFRPTGSHGVQFTGAGVHNVLFEDAGENESQFATLYSQDSLVDVVLATNARAENVQISQGIIRGDGVRLTVLSNYGHVNNGVFDVQALALRGSASTDGGTFQPDTVIFEGPAGQVLPFLAYQNVVVSGDSVVYNGFGATIPGNLRVIGNGLLDMNDQATTVGGNFSTDNNGRLQLNNTDQIAVGGDVTFNGGDQSGKLPFGTLLVGGNFAQLGGVNTFRPGQGMEVRMTGSSIQSIFFQSPAPLGSPSGSWFGNLSLENTLQGVQLNTSAFVGSQFRVGIGTNQLLRGAATDSLVFADVSISSGGLGQRRLTVDSLRLVHRHTSDFGAMLMEDVTFDEYSPDVTQFTVELPGAATHGYNNFIFNSIASGVANGFHVRGIDLDGPTSGVLQMFFNNASPGAAGPGVGDAKLEQLLGAIISWNPIF